MSISKGTREPVDRQTRIVVTLIPSTTHTVAEVALGWRRRGGVDLGRIAYWHIDVTRADLAGRNTDDVLRLLLDGVLRHLDGAHDPADQVAHGTDISGAAAPPPLEGPQGEDPQQTALPGL